MDGLRYVDRRLKLHDVRVLIAVVEAGSMVKAADRLGTSQPAVSRSIAELERAPSIVPSIEDMSFPGPSIRVKRSADLVLPATNRLLASVGF